MGVPEEVKDKVSMEKFGCKFSELRDPQDRMSVGGTIGGNIRKGQLGSVGYRHLPEQKKEPEPEREGEREGQQAAEENAE